MALAWQPVDPPSEPAELAYSGDPADVLEAVAELLERPAWHRRAACRGRGSKLWFPARGADLTPARNICAGCAVRDECLAAGMSERHGLWGGLSERQRRVERRAA